MMHVNIRGLIASIVPLLLCASLAYGQSTIDPTQPVQNSPLTSQVIRTLAAAAANDINGLVEMHAGATAPSPAYNGEDWLNTASTPAVWNKYAVPCECWTEIATINLSTGVVLFAETPVLTNVAALEALSTAATTHAQTLGYTTPGDYGGANYKSSSSACSLNAGAGDGFSEFPSADNKCWLYTPAANIVDVRAAGAVCNGTFADTPAFAAILAAGYSPFTAPQLTCVVGNLVVGADQTLWGYGATYLAPPGGANFFAQEIGNHAAVRGGLISDLNGNMVATSNLSAPVVVSVANAFTNNPGYGGTPGPICTVTGLTGTGTKFQSTVAVSGQTAAFTASIATTGIMTVTVIGSGAIVPNNSTSLVLSAAGNIPGGITVGAQLTGSAGSTGTYQLSQTFTSPISSESMTNYLSGTSGTIQSSGTAPVVTVPGSYSILPGWSNIAANVTATVAGNVMTVSAVNSGTMVASGLLKDAGGLLPVGTVVLYPLSSSTYQLNQVATIAGGETIVEIPAYQPDVTDEPVSSNCGLVGATFTLAMQSGPAPVTGITASVAVGTSVLIVSGGGSGIYLGGTVSGPGINSVIQSKIDATHYQLTNNFPATQSQPNGVPSETMTESGGVILTVANLAATSTTPAFQVEQRCGVQDDRGYWWYGWINAVNAGTSQVTLSNQLYAPAAGTSFNQIKCAFGAIWQTGANGGTPHYEQVQDVNIWAAAGVMMDALPTNGEPAEPKINNLNTQYASLFSYVMGRNAFNGGGSDLYLRGSWNASPTWTGNGATKNFLLPYRVYKAGPTWASSLTVNGVAQTYGTASATSTGGACFAATGYTISLDGLYICFATAPASGAAIAAQYVPETSEGMAVDNNGGGQNFSNVWSQGNDIDLHLVNNNQITISGFECDITTYACILYDSTAGGSIITGGALGYAPYGIRAINGARGLRIEHTFGAPPAGLFPNGIPGVNSLFDVGSNANETILPGGYTAIQTWAGFTTTYAAAGGGSPNQLGEVGFGCLSAGAITSYIDFCSVNNLQHITIDPTASVLSFSGVGINTIQSLVGSLLIQAPTAGDGIDLAAGSVVNIQFRSGLQNVTSAQFGLNGCLIIPPSVTGGCIANTVNLGALDINGSPVSAGGVSSVSNGDGTLTISPTTGAVVASLNLGNANTWTGVQTMPAGSLGSPGLTLTGAGGDGFIVDAGGYFAFTGPSGSAPTMAFDRPGATLANGSNVLNLVGFGNDNAGTPVFTEWGSLTFQALTTTGGAADQGSVNIGIDNGGAIYSAMKVKPSGTTIYATAGTGALTQTAFFSSTGIYVGSAGTVQVSDVSGNSFYPTIAAHDAVISEGGSSASVGAAGGTNCVLAWTASTSDPTCSQAPTIQTSLRIAGAGSAATPSLAVGNATTGVYSVSTTGMGFSINGTESAFITPAALTIFAHFLVSSTAPTISSCGTGSPAVAGSDTFGKITAGGGTLTSCVINFGAAYGTAPACVISSTTAISSPAVTASTTQLTISGTSLTSDVITYVCGSVSMLEPANDNLAAAPVYGMLDAPANDNEALAEKAA